MSPIQLTRSAGEGAASKRNSDRCAPRRRPSPALRANDTTIPFRRRSSERDGMALILVLAFIAMTLGVSYALVRSQSAGVHVATNGRLMQEARQAAFSGLSAGMRRISQTSWAGVGTTITGNVSTSDSYS